MATKIRLKRMGKKFYAFYRVVITDSRNKRDGKAIEESAAEIISHLEEIQEARARRAARRAQQS
mgnify:CR=1 FL=1